MQLSVPAVSSYWAELEKIAVEDYVRAHYPGGIRVAAPPSRVYQGMHGLSLQDFVPELQRRYGARAPQMVQQLASGVQSMIPAVAAAGMDPKQVGVRMRPGIPSTAQVYAGRGPAGINLGTVSPGVAAHELGHIRDAGVHGEGFFGSRTGPRTQAAAASLPSEISATQQAMDRAPLTPAQQSQIMGGTQTYAEVASPQLQARRDAYQDAVEAASKREGLPYRQRRINELRESITRRAQEEGIVRRPRHTPASEEAGSMFDKMFGKGSKERSARWKKELSEKRPTMGAKKMKGPSLERVVSRMAEKREERLANMTPRERRMFQIASERKGRSATNIFNDPLFAKMTPDEQKAVQAYLGESAENVGKMFPGKGQVFGEEVQKALKNPLRRGVRYLATRR